MARGGCSKVCKFTPPHVEPPAALCLAVSECQSQTPEGENLAGRGERPGRRRVGGSSEKRGFILEDPPAPEYIISSFIPVAEEETETELTLPRSPSHTLSSFLNEDYCEEIILFWMKIGTIYGAAIFKEGIYLLTGVHCLAVFLFLPCNLSKGDILPQNKVRVKESNILVANRMIPQIIQDDYVITKCSGIFALKKFQCKK